MTTDDRGLIKDPQDWKSGDDPATPAQESYLRTLAEQAGEDAPEGLTKAAASEKIDELRASAGLEGRSSGGVETGLGQPGPTDEEAQDNGNGEEPFRNTPVSPNANR